MEFKDKPPEVLDDLRKRRLAYFENCSSSNNEIKQEAQNVLLTSNKELEGRVKQLEENNNASQPEGRGQNAEMEATQNNDSKDISRRNEATIKSSYLGNSENPDRKASLQKSTPHIKTTSFYLSRPPDEFESYKVDRNENHMKSEKAEVADDLDGYNETVERLIKATKEELLGMKTSDDIWTRIRNGSISETDGDKNENLKTNNQTNCIKTTNDDKIATNKYSRPPDVHLNRSHNGLSETPQINAFNGAYSKAPVPINTTSHNDVRLKGQEMPKERQINSTTNQNDHSKPLLSKSEPIQHLPQNHEQTNQKSLNSTKVEEMFSSRQMPVSYAALKKQQFHLNESQDIEERFDYVDTRASQGVSELGLETHRPESEREAVDAKEEADPDDICLGDTVTKELRSLLGEDKFQQFLIKAKRDIEDLHQERLSERSDRPAKKDKTPRLLKEKPLKPMVTKAKVGEDGGSRQPKEAIVAGDIKGESANSGARQDKLTNKSGDFTPRISDGDAVHSMIGEYVLTKDTEEKRLVSNPAYKTKDISEIKQEPKSILTKRVPELNLTEINSESPRPKLNRPKHEPHTIYHDKAGTEEKEVTKSYAAKNYEQVIVPRNVSFSANEIYHQAAAYDILYGSNLGNSISSVSQPPFSSSPDHLAQAPAAMSGFPTPVTPTTPVEPQSNYYGHIQGQHGLHQSSDSVNLRRYFGSMTRQSSVPSEGTAVSASPQAYPAYFGADVNSLYYSMQDFQRYPPPEVSVRYSTAQPGSNPPLHIPRPPAKPESHPESHPSTPAIYPGGYAMAAPMNVNPQDIPAGYPYPVMIMTPHPPPTPHTPSSFQPHTPTGAPVQMVTGIPNHFPASVTPQPPMYMQTPTHQAQEVPQQAMATSSATQTSVDAAEVTDGEREDSPELAKDKGTLVEESTFTSVSQIVPEETLVPHPPAGKKEQRNSPRRHPRVDPGTLGKQDPKRHIDGIRHHHEQRRQQQEEDKLSDQQLLEKQRKFAKASLDRYFSSLENLYRRPQEETLEEDQPSDSLILSDDKEPLLETDEVVEVIDDVVSTIVESKVDTSEPNYFFKEEVEHKTFENLDAGKDMPEMHVSENLRLNFKENEDNDDRTIVNTEVSVNVGGVTERLHELGIDTKHIKTHEVSKNEKKKVEKKGKVLIVCPECEGLNKEYMSWCVQCGEMIIGVDPMLVSKNREGKLRIKPLAKEDLVQRQNVTNKKDDEVNEVNVKLVSKSVADVNYVQEVPKKSLTLDLDGIKGIETQEVTKKGSPSKSDGKDSGRPPSDETENDLQTYKIEQEVVNDICESISDPIVKGYVKSHFSKKRFANLDGKTVKEKLKEDLVLNGAIPETDTMHFIHTEMNQSGSRQVVKEEPQQEDNDLQLIKHGSVKDKIAIFSQSKQVIREEHTRPNMEIDMELESINTPTVHHVDDEIDLVPPPLPNFSTNLPTIHNELALKLPANSMDFSADFSQVGSQVFDHSGHGEEFKLEKEKEEEKEMRRKERRKKRGHGAIDVEVFGYEESRESRNSSRAPHAVPALNLAGSSDSETDEDMCNSSDDDDMSVQSDTKQEVKAQLSPSLNPANAWEPATGPHENLPKVDALKSPEDARLKARSEPVSPDIVVEQPRRDPEQQPEPAGDEWKLLFEPDLLQQDQEQEETERQEEAGSPEANQPFLMQILSQEPVCKAKNRPTSSKGKPVKSKVRQSVEEPGYQRKWARSSIAWSSYNKGELRTSSSLDLRSSSDQGITRPASAPKSRNKTSLESGAKSTDPGPSVSTPGRQGPIRSRSASASRTGYHNSGPQGSQDVEAVIPREIGPSERQNSAKKTRPASADMQRRKQPKQKGRKPGNLGDNLDLSIDLEMLVEHRLPRQGMLDRLQAVVEAPDAPDNMASPKSTYDKYIEMTPRIQEGTVSRWQCLPDEILIHIFAHLDQSSLTKCAQVCQQFYRVAMDESLWKYITIRKRADLDDTCLGEISKRHPVSLALIQCQGERVTAKGLRDLFRECSENLKELNIARCSRGALSGDSILLHAAARCHNLTHIDTSWCNITDSGLMAISNTCNRLESLCINGCQAVSNDGLETVIKRHGDKLRVLEMFGCFNISPRGLRCISNNCINLISLNIGQCYKLTDSCISQLSASLGRVETLDLRGCKQIKDNCIRRVVKNCPRLHHLSLANCPNITDVSVLEIATYLTDIRSVDLSDCKNVTDGSIRALVNTCTNLRHIDISSTSCTHRSVSMIANFSGQRLETLKINFLSDVTEQSLIKLAKHCRRLRSVHMYGCTSVRHLEKVMAERPSFTVEM